MKFSSALLAAQANSESSLPETDYFLACGFEPLHLATFLIAHLTDAFPLQKIKLETGRFGDLPGNLRAAATAPKHTVFVVIEWSDLDPRLSPRSHFPRDRAFLQSLPESIASQWALIEARLFELAQSNSIAVSLPCLPLPPIDPQHSRLYSPLEAGLDAWRAEAARKLLEHPRIRLIQRRDSPGAYDVKSDFATGFPYAMGFASELAECLAKSIALQPLKKGFITDLDNTLWKGILGEIGSDGICWSQEHHAAHHGFYQSFLALIASSGALLAIATKNDLDLVESALSRPDLITPAKAFFPIEAHWHSKEMSVERILATWNIGPADVVFVDDNPIEVETVSKAFPQMDCRLFPTGNPAAILTLVGELRDLFAYRHVSEEDLLRRDSIRAASSAAVQLGTQKSERPCKVWENLQAEFSFTVHPSASSGPIDRRAFDLVNKTNQFNLNGHRYEESEWSHLLAQPDNSLITLAYSDKFGPLGSISAAVVSAGDGGTLNLLAWVLSCRAFSRGIEHRFLQHLFDYFNCSIIRCNYMPTERNTPLREFLLPILSNLVLHRETLKELIHL